MCCDQIAFSAVYHKSNPTGLASCEDPCQCAYPQLPVPRKLTLGYEPVLLVISLSIKYTWKLVFAGMINGVVSFADSGLALEGELVVLCHGLKTLLL